MFERIMKLSQGNPGAATFLMELIKGDMANSISGLTILPTIEELEILGTDLYVLYSDLCNKDIQLMEYLCKECPGDVLKDACSRQDYSGRELVKEYVESYIK